ncbi:MAG TPA: sigma-70 family RNA polymerase sigma factor [Steroidobacter sp.]|uniref:RNA polymerase sigma factor n=1 Tax=Steroidobacter sp. TaxID=1978227 RepID=UPI002ED9D1E9
MATAIADPERSEEDQTVVPFRTREGSAFARLVYDRHDGELRRYLRRRLRSAADLDDTIQEIYVRIARYPDPGAILNTQAFVMTAAANLLRDRFAAAARHPLDRGSPIEDVEFPCARPSPERQLESQQTLALVIDALKDLAPKSRDALILHRFRDLTYPEIAKLMGLSTSMVQKHINRALVHLTQKLKVEP